MTTQTSHRTTSTWNIFFLNVHGNIMDWGKPKLLLCFRERIGRFKCCEIVTGKIMIFIVQCNAMALSSCSVENNFLILLPCCSFHFPSSTTQFSVCVPKTITSGLRRIKAKSEMIILLVVLNKRSKLWDTGWKTEGWKDCCWRPGLCFKTLN